VFLYYILEKKGNQRDMKERIRYKKKTKIECNHVFLFLCWQSQIYPM